MSKKKYKAVVINHGHMDIEWYKTLDGYRLWVADIIDRLYDECLNKDNYVTYIFDGAVFLLNDLVRHFPEYTDKIRLLVKKGKLTVGPFYTQFDEWIPSGESLVKNCLWGDRESKKWGGKPMKIGYLPDNFGHPAQLPQMLKGFGIDNLLFMRGMVDIDKGREFYFIGKDDTKCIAVNYNYAVGFLFSNNNPETGKIRSIPYTTEIDSTYDMLMTISEHKDKKGMAEKMIEVVKANKEKFSQDCFIMPMGTDHCPPQSGLGDTLALANQMQDEIEFEFASPEEYISQLRGKDLPCFKGELLGSATDYILLGVQQNRIYQKIDNFAAESLVFKYALPLYALLKQDGGGDSRLEKFLVDATEKVLLNSTHDSTHGSSNDSVHIEMAYRNNVVKQTCSDIIALALTEFAKTRGVEREGEKGFLVFNPTLNSGRQVFSILLPAENDVIIKNAEGEILPSYAIQQDPAPLNANGEPCYDTVPGNKFKKVCIAAKLKPFSIQAFTWSKKEEREEFVPCENTIENEYLKVVFENSSLTLTDKKTGKIFKKLNILSDVPDVGDAWNYSRSWKDYPTVYSSENKTELYKCEKNSLFQRMVIKGEYFLPEEMIGDEASPQKIRIPYQFEVTVYEGIRRVDVKLTFDNRAKEHMTSLEIPFDFIADTVHANGAFCHNDRPVLPYKPKQPWVEDYTEFLPFNEWVAVDDGKAGLAIATKGLCGYMVENTDKGTLLKIPVNRSFGFMSRINMVRRKYAPGAGNPFPEAQCLRRTEIEFAYIPYECGEDTTPFLKDADSFLYPAVASYQYGDFKYAKEKKSPVYTGVELIDGNLRLSLIDQTYERDCFLVRLYENQGKTQEGRLKLDGVKKAWLATLNEEKLEELTIDKDMVRFKAKPHQIITIIWSK